MLAYRVTFAITDRVLTLGTKPRIGVDYRDTWYHAISEDLKAQRR